MNNDKKNDSDIVKSKITNIIYVLLVLIQAVMLILKIVLPQLDNVSWWLIMIPGIVAFGGPIVVALSLLIFYSICELISNIVSSIKRKDK